MPSSSPSRAPSSVSRTGLGETGDAGTAALSARRAGVAFTLSVRSVEMRSSRVESAMSVRVPERPSSRSFSYWLSTRSALRS